MIKAARAARADEKRVRRALDPDAAEFDKAAAAASGVARPSRRLDARLQEVGQARGDGGARRGEGARAPRRDRAREAREGVPRRLETTQARHCRAAADRAAAAASGAAATGADAERRAELAAAASGVAARGRRRRRADARADARDRRAGARARARSAWELTRARRARRSPSPT